jgi:hypothetical protein
MAHTIPISEIYCPGEIHTTPYLLMQIGGELNRSHLFVRCNDFKCRDYSGNDGWVEIWKNKTGGYITKLVPKRFWFNSKKIPQLVLNQTESIGER